MIVYVGNHNALKERRERKKKGWKGGGREGRKGGGRERGRGREGRRGRYY